MSRRSCSCWLRNKRTSLLALRGPPVGAPRCSQLEVSDVLPVARVPLPADQSTPWGASRAGVEDRVDLDVEAHQRHRQRGADRQVLALDVLPVDLVELGEVGEVAQVDADAYGLVEA